MSGKSTETTNTQQNSRTEPWAPAQPVLGGILGALGGRLGELGPTATETQALGTLAANAQTADRFAPQIGAAAAQMLSGGADHGPVATAAYDQLQRGLLPYATGQFTDPSTSPYFQRVMDDAAKRAADQVNSTWAGWGRDASPGNARALGEGIASATAPLALDWYNKQQANQLGALNALYSAGAQTAGLLSNLDATRIANQMHGVDAANAAIAAQNAPATALLAAEAQRRGISLDMLRQLAAIGAQIGGLGHQTSAQNMSSSQKTSDPVRNIIDGARAAAGLGKLLGSAG